MFTIHAQIPRISCVTHRDDHPRIIPFLVFWDAQSHKSVCKTLVGSLKGRLVVLENKYLNVVLAAKYRAEIANIR